ncbi:hypothetical protein, partial [Escherichia coli]|uniref:hypothetical protein n=1 Tax=Escherichia coli TaxID=562 RepID=UPI001BFC5AF8
RASQSVAEQEGQLIESESTGAPHKHYHTLNLLVGSITVKENITVPGILDGDAPTVALASTGIGKA